MPTGLTPKQARFVDEYLLDLNATQAAIRAGYSENTAKQQGARLLTNVYVSAAVQAAQAKRSQRTEVTQDYVIKRLKREANRTAKGSSHSARVQALHLLGKHIKMFADQIELTGKDGGPVRYADTTDADLDAEIKRLQGV